MTLPSLFRYCVITPARGSTTKRGEMLGTSLTFGSLALALEVVLEEVLFADAATTRTFSALVDTGVMPALLVIVLHRARNERHTA